MRWSSFQVQWSQVPSSVRERLVVTGWAGHAFCFEDQNLDSCGTVQAYTADLDRLDISEQGVEEELVVFEAEDIPQSVDVDGVRVANGDRVVQDMIGANVRRFRHRFNRNATFRETLRQELSEEGKQDVIDRLGEDHFVGDLIRETFR